MKNVMGYKENNFRITNINERKTYFRTRVIIDYNVEHIPK